MRFRNNPPQTLTEYIKEQFQQNDIPVDIRTNNMGADNELHITARTSKKDELHRSAMNSFEQYWDVTEKTIPNGKFYSLSGPSAKVATSWSQDRISRMDFSDDETYFGGEILSAHLFFNETFEEIKYEKESIYGIIKELSSSTDLFLISLHPPGAYLLAREGRNGHLRYFTRMMYLGEQLSNGIGIQKLRTAPAYDITEINNGFAFWPCEDIANPDEETIRAVEDHLDMEFYSQEIL